MDNQDIIEILDEKIELARDLIQKLQDDFIHIDGARKTKNNLAKELKLLENLKRNCDETSMLKLKCSNLNFYSHLINSLNYYQQKHKILAIQKTYSAAKNNNRVLIHILCENGNGQQLWVKIIARDANGLNDEVAGNTSKYNYKDIVIWAKIFNDMASAFPAFRKPIIVFDFFHHIDEKLEAQLENSGVSIGHKFRACEAAADNKIDNQTTKLNIDVSTMIAYVSELTNGGTNFIFNDKFLDMQAKDERANPVKPQLDQYFEGNKLIACETAVESFKNIVDLMCGENEKKRAKEFIERLEVLPDADESVLNVELTCKIKERSRKIFAFGLFHSAPTVTSNHGFARAIKEQNCDVPMILHSARALTEMKQYAS